MTVIGAAPPKPEVIPRLCEEPLSPFEGGVVPAPLAAPVRRESLHGLAASMAKVEIILPTSSCLPPPFSSSRRAAERRRGKRRTVDSGQSGSEEAPRAQNAKVWCAVGILCWHPVGRISQAPYPIDVTHHYIYGYGMPTRWVSRLVASRAPKGAKPRGAQLAPYVGTLGGLLSEEKVDAGVLVNRGRA